MHIEVWNSVYIVENIHKYIYKWYSCTTMQIENEKDKVK